MNVNERESQKWFLENKAGIKTRQLKLMQLKLMVSQGIHIEYKACLLNEINVLGKRSFYAYVLPGIPPLPIAAPIRASGPDIFISTASNETSTWIPNPEV
ncbi:hypothetical protein OUZ56_033878 [Daphnia magna]|uniref:Uncharacterized protein n=1 Tax=Daphnia magna TaxID=35525 RepID=A0ABQ9ZYC0_9CRUS|nr:hypothetical protein OUZ56_033878 [Daphnia magna]